MSADDELLDLLGRTFEAPTAEPSMAELASLHRAVASMPTGRRHRRWGPRTLGLFIGLGALTTTGTAFALEGGHLPPPVVSVARTIGLPVDRDGSAPTTPTTTARPPVPTTVPVPVQPVARPTPTTIPRRGGPTTTPTAAPGQVGDDHGGGNRGPSASTPSTAAGRPTTSSTTARVDNSGPGSSSSGSGHDGGGGGGRDGSGSGGGDDGR